MSPICQTSNKLIFAGSFGSGDFVLKWMALGSAVYSCAQSQVPLLVLPWSVNVHSACQVRRKLVSLSRPASRLVTVKGSAPAAVVAAGSTFAGAAVGAAAAIARPPWARPASVTRRPRTPVQGRSQVRSTASVSSSWIPPCAGPGSNLRPGRQVRRAVRGCALTRAIIRSCAKIDKAASPPRSSFLVLGLHRDDLSRGGAGGGVVRPREP